MSRILYLSLLFIFLVIATPSGAAESWQDIPGDPVSQTESSQDDSFSKEDTEKYDAIIAALKKAGAEAKAELSGIIDDLKELVNLAKDEKAKETEILLRIRKKYTTAKNIAEEATNKAMSELYDDYDEKIGNIFDTNIITSIEYIMGKQGFESKGRGIVVTKDEYNMQAVSCLTSVSREEFLAGIYIQTKGGTYPMRSIEGQTPFPPRVDTSLSSNVKIAEVLPPNVTGVAFPAGNAAVFPYFFLIPISITVEDTEKPVEFIADVTFTACTREFLCREYMERVGFSLEPSEIEEETVICSSIRSAASISSAEEIAPVRIADVYYVKENDGISMFTDVKFTHFSYSPFLYVENDFGLTSSSIILKKYLDGALFKTRFNLPKEYILGRELTLIAGDKNVSVAKDVTPELKGDAFVQKGGRNVVWWIDAGLIFAITLLLVPWSHRLLGRFKKLKKVELWVLASLSSLVGVMIAFRVVAHILAYMLAGQVSEFEDFSKVKKELEQGRVVYVNYCSYNNLTCWYNTLVMRYSNYSKPLVDDGRLVLFRNNTDRALKQSNALYLPGNGDQVLIEGILTERLVERSVGVLFKEGNL